MSKPKSREPLEWPRSAAALRRLLRQLHHRHSQEGRELRKDLGPRRSPSMKTRELILATTANRCHICGGRIHGDDWVADHVARFASGGGSERTNYLPAHRECNGLKWYFSPRELRWMLRMGIWARERMEKDTKFGTDVLGDFWNWEKHRHH